MAEIHILRIGELQPDPYSLDDEDEYLSLDAPLDFTISAARSNQNEGHEALTKEPINQILRKRIQRENNYAAPKNIRFGEWKPVDNALPSPALLQPALLQPAPLPFQEPS